MRSASRFGVALAVVLGYLVFGPARATVPQRLDAEIIRLGGLGAGWISIAKNGSFGPSARRAYLPPLPEGQPGDFAAIWTEAEGRSAARILGATSPYGLPGSSVERTTFHYPVAEVVYASGGLPVLVSLTAHAALLPGDLSASSSPCVVLTYRLRNLIKEPVNASVALSFQPSLGISGLQGHMPDRTGVRASAAPTRSGITGVLFEAGPLVDRKVADLRVYNTRGSEALLAAYPTSTAAVTTAAWNAASSLPSWWAGFSETGHVSGDTLAGVEGEIHPAGCVAVRVQLKPDEVQDIPFAIAWYAPAYYDPAGARFRNVYTLRYRNAEEVGRNALEDRFMNRALSCEWQRRIEASSFGAQALTSLAAELEDLAASSLPALPDDLEGLTAGLRLCLTPGMATPDPREERLRACLITFFPRLNALELAAHADTDETNGKRETGVAWFQPAWQHEEATQDGPWLARVWKLKRSEALQLLDDLAAGRRAAGAWLIPLANLAASANDTTVAARAQPFMTPFPEPIAGATSSSAWVSWANRLGCRYDARSGSLTIRPSLGEAVGEITGPVFDPRYWASLNVLRTSVRALIEYRLDRVLPTASTPGWIEPERRDEIGLPLSGLRSLTLGVLPSGERPDGVSVTLGANPIPVEMAQIGGMIVLTFESPITMRSGDTLRVVLTRPSITRQ